MVLIIVLIEQLTVKDHAYTSVVSNGPIGNLVTVELAVQNCTNSYQTEVAGAATSGPEVSKDHAKWQINSCEDVF